MSVLFCTVILLIQTNDPFLPRWMTPEESLMIDKIGQGHIITAPPGGWVETPGEFEPLKGVFITWIWNQYNSVFREIVREVVEVSRVYIVVGSSSEQTNITNYLQSNGIPLDSVTFYIWPRNSIWMRDYGPWFIRKEDNSEGIVDFIYNRPRPSDDTIPWRIGQQWGIPVYGSPLTHPGGNFMVDGLGTGFSSNLIYDENPSYTPEEIDSLMLEYNGLEQFIVLDSMITEYTKHIDLWAKVLNDTLVMVGEYTNTNHPDYQTLNNNADSISRCKNREGQPYRVVRIPMPYSTSNAPPSYLNSLFVNNKVLVPLWGEPEDDTALFIYQQALPGYTIVGIDCSSMAGSGGAIHCITMQAPSPRFIHILHYPLTDTEDTLNPYRVRARITTSNTLQTDSTVIFYKINSGSFTTTPLSVVSDTPGVYAGYIPSQSAGDTVHYYLLVKNNDGVRRTSPVHAPAHIYSFLVGPDAVPPEIIHTPLSDQLVSNWPAHVTATVTDNSGVDSVILEYSINSSPQSPILMQNTGGDLYEADFAGTVNVGDSIFYRIKAVDGSVNHNTAYHPPSGYHSFAIIDKIPVGIWEPDQTPITSTPLINFLDSAGIAYEYNTSYPTFDLYTCIFICLGVYSNNYQLTNAQANDLVSYLNNGGRCYMEGGDAWCYDPAGSIYRSYFGISQVDDGSTMTGNINGVSGTFTEGMSFAYAGENSYMDRIAPVSPAFTIFTNGGYNRTVAYDAGTYRTIGSSFELGGLTDGASPSTKSELIQQILIFFGIIVGSEEEQRFEKSQVDLTSVTPNPVRRDVTFNISLQKKSDVRIDIYNVLGQRVKSLEFKSLKAGGHNIEWNLHDDRNRMLAQGAYFYRVTTDKGVTTGKILLIK
ncbi:MAG TPA: T9SS type A sorting domain-containing protein [candidate division WOR-3 bacterium]|uniref:T9SS type A sorting domain-containing protein n=1 Tax=candidate division WOR-3 bacterium TaxID=2052148 RepID=A0A9C9ENB7_UNCW3|nr:T9SS type A sorting domain-containing protein [candidate division WOR-3 bacterium]